MVEAVVSDVTDAHTKKAQLLGLPYPELPVIAVSGASATPAQCETAQVFIHVISGGSSSVVSDVVARLEQPLVQHSTHTKAKGRSKVRKHSVDTERTCIVSHLYAADCPNLQSAMKAIVTSFVDRQVDESEEEQGCIQCTCCCLQEHAFI